MSRFTTISLAVLILLGFVCAEQASARPFDAEKAADRTVRQMTKAVDGVIITIERVEQLGVARIDKFYEAGKEKQAQRFERQIVRMISNLGDKTNARLEMFKDRTYAWLVRSGELELAADFELQCDLLIEKLILETEQSIAAVTGDIPPEIDPETDPEVDPEQDPEIIDAE